MDVDGVFVSYRRSDTLGSAHGVHRDLRRALRESGDGSREVFLDIDSIDPGLDFRDVISETLQRCSFVLVVIGPRWLSATDERGRRRLDSPSDTHVLEIAAALNSDAFVIPVLVEDADMPDVDDLPDRIKDLAYRNAWIIDHRRFEAGVNELAQAVLRLEARRGVPQAAAEKAEKAAEKAEKTAAGEKAEKAAAEKARMQSLVEAEARPTLIVRVDSMSTNSFSVALSFEGGSSNRATSVRWKRGWLSGSKVWVDGLQVDGQTDSSEARHVFAFKAKLIVTRSVQLVLDESHGGGNGSYCAPQLLLDGQVVLQGTERAGSVHKVQSEAFARIERVEAARRKAARSTTLQEGIALARSEGDDAIASMTDPEFEVWLRNRLKSRSLSKSARSVLVEEYLRPLKARKGTDQWITSLRQRQTDPEHQARQ